MILNLKAIFSNEKANLTFDYMLDLKSFEFSDGEFPFKSPIRVYGEVSEKTGMTKLGFNTEFDFYTQCDRCLKEITEHYKFTFENILVKTLETFDSVDLLLVEDETLDLDELAKSNILLDLPMKHLCDKNCKGLCSKCGKSLEFGDCGCTNITVDPRLESLKSFLE